MLASYVRGQLSAVASAVDAVPSAERWDRGSLVGTTAGGTPQLWPEIPDSSVQKPNKNRLYNPTGAKRREWAEWSNP